VRRVLGARGKQVCARLARCGSARRRSRGALGVMTATRYVASLVLAGLGGCASTPRTFGANDSCDLPPNVWREVPAPAERESLLGLPESATGKPVRQVSVATAAQLEAWLQDANGNLQLCIYNPRKRLSCYSGELATTTFTRVKGIWRAGATMRIFCTT
jgi:hypothetical protein